MLFISLRSDWTPKEDGPTYEKGSLLYVSAETFLSHGKEACDYSVLFAPTPRTALEYYSVTKNYVVLVTMDNVQSKMDFYQIVDDSTQLKRVGGDSTPKIRSNSVSPVDALESDEFWFTTSGYTQPSTLFLADASKSLNDNDNDNEDAYVIQKLKSLPPQYDSTDLEVQQRTAISKDGTEVPYFLIMKKGTKLNGKNPTLVYGYGGFEISMGPHYTATAGIAWLERGGVYVEAIIRGGGEFGPSWHQAALKANRNKSYEDFIAVGEDVVQANICQPSTMAIRGGSNGGLLMGNMYNMRPDLFGAIHSAVPLFDMQRYHKLLAGASWMGEYGDPDTDDWDNFLHKYSPYHNIDETNPKYPPMLVTTSTRDDRVHPGHARKLVKKIQDLGNDKDWPIYYYENIEGGHGGAADAKQSAFMTSLAYDFMFSTLVRNAEKIEKDKN
uniref:Prolyl endopeptidase n=1 Tax=Cyclophora tenuis TaxID=216820 RepID=A0A7S1GJZ9_CYCTE|mmetsp:Transcript_14329/g.24358  ORF Transcript_14329/g.24358 Transcript_14329/m.24358 type:complete len:441 (+) Transcript_14329:1-1323(+)